MYGDDMFENVGSSSRRLPEKDPLTQENVAFNPPNVKRYTTNQSVDSFNSSNIRTSSSTASKQQNLDEEPSFAKRNRGKISTGVGLGACRTNKFHGTVGVSHFTMPVPKCATV